MENETDFETSTAENTVFLTYLVFISLMGTVTNFMVIFVIVFNHTLQTKTNYIVLNLAISDFFVAAVAIPLRFLGNLTAPDGQRLVPCNVAIAFTILFDGVSRMSIVLITLDRFVAVKFPFWYAERMSKRTTVVLIYGCWLSMGLFAILLLTGVGVITDAPSMGFCLFSSTLSKASVLTFAIIFCLVPLVAVFPMNCYLLKTSFRQMRKIHDLQMSVTNALDGSNGANNDTAPQEKEFILKQRKVVRMVVVLVGLFIILVAPISVIDLLETLGGTSVPALVSKLAVCLIYSNSFLNVFVYAGYNSTFREALRGLFPRLKTCLAKPCGTSN